MLTQGHAIEKEFEIGYIIYALNEAQWVATAPGVSICGEGEAQPYTAQTFKNSLKSLNPLTCRECYFVYIIGRTSVLT
jgi:hypothetical protein